ncbi:hypothetical protein B0G71_4365 [Paraburkholderia sp. BL27I4N3]|uniref:hypothetical protein n=1 Tax=Paraburkholderia sp. BL27I4N3 TaxID=1938805 RepID=UPI000E267E3B|nr:hypothetical protein [Paraburkholderia sp. BL27I4N3]REE21213.1 hypothetical protein B0G71_4365 [Paraburkholderia sp. BL27I4N3]
MSNTYTTCPVGVPSGKIALSAQNSGTITGIACTGPCVATVYNAAGTALTTINSPGGFNAAVSLAFSGGPPYVVQQSQSSMIFTI